MLKPALGPGQTPSLTRVLGWATSARHRHTTKLTLPGGSLSCTLRRGTPSIPAHETSRTGKSTEGGSRLVAARARGGERTQ